MRCGATWRAARVVAAAAVAGAVQAQGAAPAPTPAAADALAPAAWLAGCWAHERGEPGSGEVWSAAAGGTMPGLARVVRGGRTALHERLMLRNDEAGRLVYVAWPSGQQETLFTATRTSADELVFENPAHDFPQRIAYRRHGEDRVTVRVEGMRQGTLRGFDVPLRRTPCDPAPLTPAR